MVLLANGTPLPGDGYDLVRSALAVPEIRGRSTAFATSCPRPVPASTKSICIIQQEMSTVRVREEPDTVVGSVDATTCVIVGVVAGDGDVTVGHLDSPQSMNVDCLMRLCRGLKHGEGEVGTLHVVGGYLDENGLSARILARVFAFFAHLQDVRLEVGVACVAEVNTYTDPEIGVPRPIHTAMAIKGGTGEVFPPDFHDRGPSPHVRSACLWGMNSGLPSREVYNARLGRMVIRPFEVHLDQRVQWHIRTLLALPDGEFIEQVSTSPKVEPVNFTKDTRAALGWILEHCNAGDVFAGGAWEYEWVAGRGWVAVAGEKKLLQGQGGGLGVAVAAS